MQNDEIPRVRGIDVGDNIGRAQNEAVVVDGSGVESHVASRGLKILDDDDTAASLICAPVLDCVTHLEIFTLDVVANKGPSISTRAMRRRSDGLCVCCEGRVHCATIVNVNMFQLLENARTRRERERPRVTIATTIVGSDVSKARVTRTISAVRLAAENTKRHVEQARLDGK